MSGFVRIWRSECRRFALRNTSKVVALAAIVLVFIAVGLLFVTHSGADPDLAAAKAQAEREAELCAESFDPELTPETVDEWCETDYVWYLDDQRYHASSLLGGPVWVDDSIADWSEAREVLTARERFVTQTGVAAELRSHGFTGDLVSLGGTLAVVAGLLGATYVGADFRSSVVESQLIREPRRARLLAAKAVAAASLASLGALVTLVVFVAGAVLVAGVRGDYVGTDWLFWSDVAGVVGRSTAAAGTLATVCGLLAAVAGNAVGPSVALLGSIIVGGIAHNTLGGLLARIAPLDNLVAWIALGDVGFQRAFRTADSTFEEYWDVALHGWVVAGLVLLAMVTLSWALGTFTFRRRDVL